MVFEIGITLLLVLMNGFFVAAEFAIVKVRASQLEMKVQEGSQAAVLSRHIVSHLDGYLAATQLGVTLASLGLGWIGEPVVSKMIIGGMHMLGLQIEPKLAHDIALPVAFVIITILHIVFGELAPKSLAIQRSESTVLVVSYPLQAFYTLFRPFIWLLNNIANGILKVVGLSSSHEEIHTSEELKYLVEQGKHSGVIKEDDYDIIKNAFDFRERTAKQIMVPRTRMLTIDINGLDKAAIEKVVYEGYSRIPCYEDTPDNIIGILHLKDLLMNMQDTRTERLKEIMHAPIYVPETKKLGHLLREFQVKHQQIAIVVNEYGGTKGLVTMEDILEELVGEIQDESDNETKLVEKIGEKLYNVAASTSLDDINEWLPHPVERNDQYETLAGYLIHQFERIPNTGERIIIQDYEFTIMKKSKNLIVMVQMKDLKEDPKPQESKNQ